MSRSRSSNYYATESGQIVEKYPTITRAAFNLSKSKGKWKNRIAFMIGAYACIQLVALLLLAIAGPFVVNHYSRSQQAKIEQLVPDISASNCIPASEDLTCKALRSKELTAAGRSFFAELIRTPRFILVDLAWIIDAIVGFLVWLSISRIVKQLGVNNAFSPEILKLVFVVSCALMSNFALRFGFDFVAPYFRGVSSENIIRLEEAVLNWNGTEMKYIRALADDQRFQEGKPFDTDRYYSLAVAFIGFGWLVIARKRERKL